MLENFRKALNKCGDYAALLTGLSKAFDGIPDDLIIAKLLIYSFDLPLFKHMDNYLPKRQ